MGVRRERLRKGVGVRPGCLGRIDSHDVGVGWGWGGGVCGERQVKITITHSSPGQGGCVGGLRVVDRRQREA